MKFIDDKKKMVSRHTYIHTYTRTKKKEREVENKVKIDKGSPHKRTESPWISSKPALFSVLY